MFLVNRANLDDATTWASSIFSGINFLMNSRFINSVSNAINNISAHYDISNDMFASFLSKDMTYSCAIFESKDEPLEIAQYRKLKELDADMAANLSSLIAVLLFAPYKRRDVKSRHSHCPLSRKSWQKRELERRDCKTESRLSCAIIENMRLNVRMIKLSRLR